MNQFVRESKRISPSSKCLVILLMLVTATLLPAQQPTPDGVKFEVVSVKVLSDREAADRSPDFVGPNIAIRLRLSTAAHGISFYSWRNSAIPAGYKVQRVDHTIVWLYGKGGTEKKTSSPGLNAVLFGSSGEWMTLPAHSAVEWEELDSTSFAGEIHAFTVFLKQRDTDHPLEVISDAFAVPSSGTPTTRPETP
jgi:hypothetical protein